MTSLTSPLQLGFLASHGGSNMQAILDAISAGRLNAQARLVICNNSQAKALDRARQVGMPALHLSSTTHPDVQESGESSGQALGQALDDAMAEAMGAHGVELIVCAGFMRKVGKRLLAAYPNHILNIHPALLPRHGGQGMYGIHVHQSVLAAGDKETGVTIHLVNNEYDRGPILAQAAVPVETGDTPETLQARVLRLEHILYAETLQKIAMGEISLD